MREFTIENDGISTNLIYEVNQKESMDSVILRMVENNKINDLLPMTYTQIDTKKYLKYNITSKVTMEQFFENGVTKEKLVKCFSNIITAINNLESFMIELCDLIIDIKHIYVNVSNCSIELLCLPIMEEKNICNLEMFFKNIIFSSDFDQSENCDYVAKLISFFNSQPFSVDTFKEILEEIISTPISQVKESNQIKSNFIPLNEQQVAQSIGEQPVSLVQPDSVLKKPSNQKTIVDASVFQPESIKDSTNIQKKEKVGFFGKKKKKKEKEKNLSSPVLEGMSIPGQQQEDTIIGTTSEKKSGALNVPVTGGIEKANLSKIPDSTFTQVSGSFGETTVLGVSGGAETTMLGVDSLSPINLKPYLIRRKNQEKVYINMEVFKIGKENSYVDYFIGDNAAISRSHANIIKKGEKYYIIDMNSKNHTYVNEKMIQPNVEIELESGTVIKLANEEFDFKIG